MEDLIDREEMLTCPYESSHQIRRYRMDRHLVLCKKNYPNQPLMQCDFNVTHMVPEVELQFHHSICPDRRKIEANLAYTATTGPKFVVPALNIATEECWDDINVPTYDPKKYMEDKDILQQMKVESASKKNTFRMQERLRLSNLETAFSSSRSNGTDNNFATGSTANSIGLPPRREITNIEDTGSKMQELKDKLQKGAHKVFHQK